ncbi:hypothetical protein [Brachybacterium paraconglomeratum]|uniref:hypothetical protein n=1 Tax=Brachybacterium paraconglomeratum TaxID=173362 RepID=UPI0022B06A1F|nr:hypothetical protein [Brachybacterium paraconglomeratum]MCZ4325723.1 hypothetical protein [Brachybacterium paraconglomeratum]
MTSATSPTPPDARDPEDVPPASGPKSWSKGKLAGIIGGGCCGLLLLAVIGIVILGTIIGPDDDAEPSASATTTAEPAATEEEPEVEETTEAEAPSEEPSSEEPSSEAAEEPAEEETTEAEAEAPAEDPEAWASEVEETALMGSADWQEMCGGDYSLGACWISDVTSTSVGTLDVTLQLNGSDAEAKGLAEGAANIIFSTAGPAHEDLAWVVVYDASGVVIDQKKRSDYPLLEG